MSPPKAGYPRQPWQDTGAKIFGSNFIFRIQYIKMTVTTHSTRERKKKPQYRLRKWPREVPAPQSWCPKCVERSQQRHIPKLQLCHFHLGFQPRDLVVLETWMSVHYALTHTLYDHPCPLPPTPDGISHRDEAFEKQLKEHQIFWIWYSMSCKTCSLPLPVWY